MKPSKYWNTKQTAAKALGRYVGANYIEYKSKPRTFTILEEDIKEFGTYPGPFTEAAVCPEHIALDLYKMSRTFSGSLASCEFSRGLSQEAGELMAKINKERDKNGQ